MKATIYRHRDTGNIRILLESGNVWFHGKYSEKWMLSACSPHTLSGLNFEKLATVNNFKMTSNEAGTYK